MNSGLRRTFVIERASTCGRLVLINSVVTSIVMFILSFFEIPRSILQKLNYFWSRFFWQSDEHKKKIYHLTRWSVICQPRDLEGRGVKDLYVQNQCLLSKWLFKLTNEDGMWPRIMWRKYLKDKTIGQVQKKPRDS